jgi:hypothetical protein
MNFAGQFAAGAQDAASKMASVHGLSPFSGIIRSEKKYRFLNNTYRFLKRDATF